MKTTHHHEQISAKENLALKIVYWVLGSLSFLQLLAVGTAFTLSFSDRNKTAYSPSLSEPNNEQTQGEIKKTSPQSELVDEELLNSIRPRTVEEMLKDASSMVDSTAAASASSPAPQVTRLPPPTPSLRPQHSEPSQELTLSPQLAQLLKQSRYYQIEGDMKRSILKLEEAAALSPDNPVVHFYFGLAYEAIRNAEKSREYFIKVVTMREKAGKYFPLAAKHLETGFSSPAERRGDMAFGTILEYREPDSGDGERVVLTIPILMKENLNIRPEDLSIPIHFFDIVNNKKIDPTRAEEPQVRWVNPPVDWAEGEETLEVRYHMPQLTQDELTAYGDLKYYGFTAKLYYKGEPMDCHAAPNVLFLIEQMNQARPLDGLPEYFYNDGPGVLPPNMDSEPAYKSSIMSDPLLLAP